MPLNFPDTFLNRDEKLSLFTVFSKTEGSFMHTAKIILAAS